MLPNKKIFILIIFFCAFYIKSFSQELKPQKGENIIIPIEIQDIALAKGLEIQIEDEDGNLHLIKIPKRKVFLPIRFFFEVPNLGKKGKNGGANGSLILEIHPKISFRLKTDIDKTADYGIIFKAQYENVLKIKLTDVLNEKNYRDLSLNFTMLGKEDEKYIFDLENLFNTQNPRKIGIFRRERIGKKLLLDLRFENGGTKGGNKFGSNLVYQRKNKEFIFGNIDNQVEDVFHLQTNFYEKIGTFSFRVEGFNFQKPPDYNLSGLFIEKFGFQYSLEKEDVFAFKIGNLKIEKVLDDLDKGKVDDKLNIFLSSGKSFGNPFIVGRTSGILGDLNFSLNSIGRESWLRGEAKLSFYLSKNLLLEGEVNEDFLFFRGSSFHLPWQSRRVTLMQFRNWGEEKSFLKKFGLTYIFLEGIIKRSGYDTSFKEGTKIRFGFGKDIMIYNFGLPLEFFIEKPINKKLNIGVLFSLRQWL